MNLISVTFSKIELFKSWSFRIVIVAFTIYGLSHYSENPSGLTIFAIIGMSLAAILHDEQICIYESYWEKNRLYVFGLIKLKKTYDYRNIKSIVIEGDSSTAEQFINDTILNRYDLKSHDTIEITDLNDCKTYIKTKIDIETLRKCISTISGMLNKK